MRFFYYDGEADWTLAGATVWLREDVGEPDSGIDALANLKVGEIFTDSAGGIWERIA